MVSAKSVTFEHGVVCKGERLYQRPNKARFGVKIAIDWKAVILRIVKEVHSRCFDAICCQIFAAPRMFYFFTPLTSVLIWTGAVEPDSGGITNLLTGPPLETRVGLTAAVATMVSSLNKVSSINFVLSHQIVVAFPRFVFQCRWFHLFIYVVQLTVLSLFVVFVVHGNTATIISAHQVTISDFVHCQGFKHMTLKGVVRRDVLVYDKLEDLTNSAS